MDMPSITIDGKELYYEDRGAGFPLLFGHSYLWDVAMWEPQVASLSRRYRCIVPELWSHGHSDPPGEESYPLERLAADYWALVQALGIEEFAVVGLSVGGMWGTQMALDHPEAVRALAVMDSFVGAEPEENRARYFQMMGAVEQAGGFPGPILDAVVPLFFSPVTLGEKPQLVEGFRRRLSALSAEQIPGILSVGRGIFSRDSIFERLGEIDVPSLVMVGPDEVTRILSAFLDEALQPQ
jgi:pimeloyl-ACP methyl ester carboxylesterase